MPSEKTNIIAEIFDGHWNPKTGDISNTIVTLQDVQDAIGRWKKKNPKSKLSAKNPAIFFKDLTRKRDNANINWPSSVFAKGYTARQLTGGGKCFEFIRTSSGQKEPFPASIPIPTENTPLHRITSAVIPVASRAFGRADEPWLLQIIVRLRIVETHLALFSPRRESIRQVDHLQNSVKLPKSEIDAVFLGIEQLDDGTLQEFLITCEVKQQHEDLNLDQLLRQPKAAFQTKSIKQNLIVPIAIKAIGQSQIHVIEFDPVRREDAEAIDMLVMASDAIYSLEPPVPGIGR